MAEILTEGWNFYQLDFADDKIKTEDALNCGDAGVMGYSCCH